MTTSELTPTSLEPRTSARTQKAEPLSIKSRSQFQVELQRLYRHRLAMVGLTGVLLLIAAALLAPWLAPYPFAEQHLDFIRVPPGSQFFFGTDSLGRDILSRLLYGARMALLVGIVVVAIETVVGVLLGMAAGYFRGYTDLVLIMLALPGALLTASALSFLGFGVQPPAADWGAMLNEGRPYLQEAPWIATFPGLAILLTVVCFNLLGDGVRDAFDPRQRSRE